MAASKQDYVRIAEQIKRTRRQAEALASNPGLTGITTSKGVESLQAVLDDMTRAVAFALAEGNPAFSFDRFVAAADVSWLRP